MYFTRGKNKISNPDNLSDIYNKYIQDKEEGTPYAIDRRTFIAMNESFYSTGVHNILYKGREFHFPFGLGFIRIEKNKPTKFKSNSYIDWKATVALGKRVYHLNEHSDGYNYYIRWRAPKSRLFNRGLYKFIPTRDFKRSLAKIIKNKEFDYVGEK